jgi:hypothetical protein
MLLMKLFKILLQKRFWALTGVFDKVTSNLSVHVSLLFPKPLSFIKAGRKEESPVKFALLLEPALQASNSFILNSGNQLTEGFLQILMNAAMIGTRA